MSLVHGSDPTSLREQIDLSRWPALKQPPTARVRAAAARLLMRKVARDAGIRVELQDGSGFGDVAGPVLRVHDAESFFTRLGRDGKIGLGESFMAGDWSADDLVAVLEPLARNVGALVPRPLQAFRRLHDARLPAAEDNDHAGARRNIAHHYDLSNELFATFLDETMTYSSALFDHPERESLADAQRRKVDRLLDALHIGAGSRLLEIGTGWGELALRAARRGAQVTSLTLSTAQAKLARERIDAAGLAGSVDVRVEDYRDVDGQYDAIVSVEMIEAVGERWWPTYFRTLDQRLRSGGRVGLQAILMPHDRMLASRRSWSWIQKYIFPGGIIMSEQAIDATVARHTTLHTVDRLHFGRSYAETLRRWRERFTANAAQVAALGFDETFRRMWTFYLAYCEAGFRAGYLDVGQFVLARPGEAQPA